MYWAHIVASSITGGLCYWWGHRDATKAASRKTMQEFGTALKGTRR